ncbi:MAG: hypothetical protein CMJ39_08020 [Phycisphaerae bacterium]|nr:hypothetical protein [Phycisphaerae bacterium]
MSHWFEAEDHASRALDMFERGRWAEAEVELRQALAIQPDHPEWLFNLGIVLESGGRDLQARDVFERAADLAPDQIELVASAAMACARLGESDRALHWLDRVLKIDPANEDAHARRIEMLASKGSHDEAETAFYLAELSMDQPSGLCLLEVSVSLIARGQYRRAGWCLREAMRLEPGLPRIRLRLAEVHASTGQTERALQLCGREVREDPANLEALSLYASLLEKAGRLIEAIEVVRRMLDFDPASVSGHERFARLLIQLGHDEQALVELQLVRKLDPEHQGIDLALGEIQWRLEHHGLARISLQRAYERCCDQIATMDADVAELVRLATLLLKADLSSEAVVLLESVCEQGDVELEHLLLLARARYSSGDCRGGMILSRRVLRRTGGRCIMSIHNLAMGAMERGRDRIARAWIRRGLELSPSDQGLRRIRLRLWLRRMKQMCGFRAGGTRT